MHSHSIIPWSHDHVFLGEHHSKHERRTWSVVTLTSFMMVAEITGGTLFGSIALIADGWHMATYVAALAIAGLAYLFARRHANDARFSLGTGKFGELAAFSSAVILAMIALGIGYELLLRLLHPVSIHYQEAIPIAALGLCVNLLSAWLLREDHDHDHSHDRTQHAHHHDANLYAAYIHVLADAMTSVLAIAGLSFGLDVRMEFHGSTRRNSRCRRDRELGPGLGPYRWPRAARYHSRSGARAAHSRSHGDRRRPADRSARLAARPGPFGGDRLGHHRSTATAVDLQTAA